MAHRCGVRLRPLAINSSLIRCFVGFILSLSSFRYYLITYLKLACQEAAKKFRPSLDSLEGLKKRAFALPLTYGVSGLGRQRGRSSVRLRFAKCAGAITASTWP